MSRRPLASAATAVLLAGAATAALVWSSPASATETYPLPSSGSITVVGHGNGHGHGLSQYGAQGAAQAGLTAAQIVAFYYAGSSRVVLSKPATIKVLLSGTGSSTVVSAAAGLTFTGYGTLPAGYSRYRVTGPGGVSTLQLDGLVGTTWRMIRSGLPNGGEFARPANYERVWFTDHSSTDYRGAVRVVRGGSGVFTINRAGLDQYTEGVVPREMPASWAAAAVQAQAMAVRSYGRNAQENNGGNAYDICDTTQCQVYGGMTHYDAGGNVAWTDDPAALTGNASTVLQYGGRTIFAQFSASDGGWTVDGGQPYLAARQDPYDNAGTGDPYLNWTRTPSVAAIAASYGLARVTSIQITARDGHGQWGGRVLAGTVNGVDGSGATKHISVTGFGLQDALGLPQNWFTISPPNLSPIGHVDRVAITSPRVFTTMGWSFDPNHPDRPGQVALKVDGTLGSMQATTVSRPDVQRVYGLLTPTVGFGIATKVSPGTHTICMDAQDQDGGGTVQISCSTVTMPDQIGSADVIAGGTKSVRVAGWSLDPDHSDLAGRYQVIVDGTAGPVQTATLSRLDVQRIYHTVSATFGFDVTVAASAGTHTVCLAAIDQDGQAPVQVRCASVTVS